MRFVLIGAGGVGGVTGALLARAGEAVCLVVRPAHAEAIRSRGLEIVEKNGERWTARPAVATSVADASLRPDDIVLVTAKSYDSAGILDDVAQVLPDGPAAYVCIQNGVSNEPQAAERFANIYGAMAFFQGRLIEPGRVGAGIRRIVIGRFPTGRDALCDEIVRRLTAAGLDSSVNDDIMPAKWTKLVTNCGNAIYAITNQTGAAASQDPATVDLFNRTWAEAEAVLAAAGIAHAPVAPMKRPTTDDRRPTNDDRRPTNAPVVDRSDRSAPSDNTGQTAPVDFYGSTWDDLAAQKGKVEVDWFNGEIIRLGARVGIATPVNRLLLDICTEMATKRELPGKYTSDDLLGML